MPNRHTNPDDCLQFLGFEHCDGGRYGFYHKTLRTEVPRNIQDCAVVATSLAAFPVSDCNSPQSSYLHALAGLKRLNRQIKPWKARAFKEANKRFILRRIKETCAELITTNPKHQDPRYGTNTKTLSILLIQERFTFVFGEPLPPARFCLCQKKGRYVVDGRFGNGEDHAFAVIDETIVADYDFRQYREDFHVMHIWYRK